jgi:hypothetical protein
MYTKRDMATFMARYNTEAGAMASVIEQGAPAIVAAFPPDGPDAMQYLAYMLQRHAYCTVGLGGESYPETQWLVALLVALSVDMGRMVHTVKTLVQVSCCG